MATQEADYSDGYVAGLLKQDAKESSRNYSSLGLQAFLPKRPTGAAPKPNTRFLRNIIRETDSHNSALLAKEKREAKERQKQLDRSADGRLTTLDVPHRSHHSRSNEQSFEHSRNRKRNSVESNVSDIDNSHRSRRSKPRGQSISRSRSRSRSPRRHLSKREDRDKASGHRRKSPESRSRRDRDRDRRSDDTSKRREHRSKYHRRDRGRSQSTSTSPHRKRKDAEKRKPDHDKSSSKTECNGSLNQNGYDSDPLDAFIGPPSPPKVHSKGRGVRRVSPHSAIDSHFASGYDPSLDVNPDPDSENDWDQALEAMRDRQRWKQQGAARLKSAGFSEAEVKKWAKGGEKDESDVVWAKKGQGREWDRGKVVDADGVVELKPNWA